MGLQSSLAQVVTKQVYLIIGQSNAAGRGELPTNMVALNGVDILNSNGVFVPATPALNIYSTINNGETQGYNLGYRFGQTMRNNTGVDVGLVVNARGGSPINHWVQGASQGYFDEAVERTHEALEISGTSLAGVIWHQGESSYARATYLAELTSIIDDLRDEFNDPDLPVVAGELYYKSTYLNFNYNVISQVPNLIDNTAVTSSVGLSTFDNIHFTGDSQQVFGDRYAVEMLRLLGYTNITVQNRPGVSLDGGTFFRPDPSKEYYIQNLAGVRLAANGSSNTAYAASGSTTGSSTKWKFVKKVSSGTYHIERAAGGTNKRLQTLNTGSAAMTTTGSSGTWTSFVMEEKNLGDGIYHITAINGPNLKRLYLNPGGYAGMTTDSQTGNLVDFYHY